MPPPPWGGGGTGGGGRGGGCTCRGCFMQGGWGGCGAHLRFTSASRSDRCALSASSMSRPRPRATSFKRACSGKGHPNAAMGCRAGWVRGVRREARPPPLSLGVSRAPGGCCHPPPLAGLHLDVQKLLERDALLPGFAHGDVHIEKMRIWVSPAVWFRICYSAGFRLRETQRTPREVWEHARPGTALLVNGVMGGRLGGPPPHSTTLVRWTTAGT